MKATAAGTVRRLLVAPGATVTKDQPVLEITVELPADPVAAAPDATGAVAAPKPKVRTATVKAPAAGRVASLDVLVDQTVAVGDVLGSVSPGTLSVTAPLTQAEQFRLLSPPATAQVTVRGGPAPFTCTGLTLGGEQPATAAPPSGSTDPAAQPSSPTTGTTARCAVPAGTTVFAGMAATVAVQAGTATAVPLLPVTAVQGSVQAGKVWVVGADGGEPVETPVTLGLTDGDQVQITGGVTEGQQVLQFVPVPDDTPADGAPGGMGFGG